MLTKRLYLIEISCIFFFSLWLFTFGVKAQEIVGFESRFYLFALEMWKNGTSWFPTTYGQPYPDYPVTSTLLIYLSALLTGGLNKFSAVLPSAMAASMTVTMTYLIGAETSKRYGLYAVFFLLLTFSFLKAARSITLDLYPALITTCCFYVIYIRDKQEKPLPWQWISFLFLLGFAFRGPIGMVIPAAVVCVYYLQEKKWKYFFLTGFLALFLLLLSSFFLLLAGVYIGGYAFAKEVLRMEVLGRMNQQALPFYFYLVTGMKDYLLSFPLAIVTIIGILYSMVINRKNIHPPVLLQLTAWMMVILIGMSIPGDKKIRYILPMIPACALLSAYIFIDSTKEKYFIYLRLLLFTLLLFLPAICFFLILYIKMSGLTPLPFPYFQLMLFFLSLQTGAMAIYFVWRKKSSRETGIFLVALSSFLVMNIKVIEPIELYFDRAKDLVTKVESMRLQKKAALVFYKERPDGLPIKYLINRVEQDTPVFINHEKELLKVKQPAFFVTSEDYFKELTVATIKKINVIAQDKLGHTPVVIFEWRPFP